MLGTYQIKRLVKIIHQPLARKVKDQAKLNIRKMMSKIREIIISKSRLQS